MIKNYSKDLGILSGNDLMPLPFMPLRAVGIVSVMSKIAAQEMANLIKLASGGNFRRAMKEYQILMVIMSTILIERNPLPINFC
jgi:dihydrodipicolinate synthase/N-acetylneuraminate lyase